MLKVLITKGAWQFEAVWSDKSIIADTMERFNKHGVTVEILSYTPSK